MMLPQLGTCGGVPAPMKLKTASVIMAEAQIKVACTSTGARVLGRMWRHSVRKNPVPAAIAASTKGCSRKLSTTPRTSRATRGTSAMVMARTTLPRLALVSAISAIASSTGGIDINPSMTRMIMASAMRLKPVTRPMARPITVLSEATPSPTASDTRAP